jgi:anti-sigma28 factor (negative regulator of flagellin synthesis)
MKISIGTYDNVGLAPNPDHTTRVGQTQSVPQVLGSQQFGMDRVDVSDVAQTAASVMGTASNQRIQQVANLTQIYQSGQYNVDPGRLSQAIVDQDTDPTVAH